MARHRSHSIEFKRQVAQEFIAGETLHALAKRHDVSRNLIRVWVNTVSSDYAQRAANHPLDPETLPRLIPLNAAQQCLF